MKGASLSITPFHKLTSKLMQQGCKKYNIGIILGITREEYC